jgi:hypothetical protein
MCNRSEKVQNGQKEEITHIWKCGNMDCGEPVRMAMKALCSHKEVVVKKKQGNCPSGEPVRMATRLCLLTRRR